LKKEHIDKEFHFVMGSDLISSLDQWHEGDKLISDVNFVIYPRAGYDLDLTHKNMPANYLHKAGSDNYFGMISSTEVRRRIAESRASE
jgi:nicotinate-nucleotide adenylyltransferase